jgi:hypothetical protein
MSKSPAAKLPIELIQQLHQVAASGGAAQVAAERREVAVTWLTQALLDFESLKRHIDLLSSLHDEPFRVPQPRRDSWIDTRAEPPPQTAFRFSQPLADELVVRIMDDGIGCLDATQLAELLLNPYALYDLHDVIDDTLPATWLAARSGTDSVSPTNPTPAEPAQRDQPGPAPAASAINHNWLGTLLAAAACLVIGVTVGIFLRSDGGQVPFEVVALATASVTRSPTRGAGDSQAMTIRCERKGFASIVALYADDDVFVFPGATNPIPVQPGKPGESPPLPSRAEKVMKLVVVTEQPAGAILQRELEGQQFSPVQVSQLQSKLERILREYNYQWVAFAIVQPSS